jgi:hypothetical protein
MPDGADIPPRAIINIVSFTLLFNIVTMALAFAVIGGVAELSDLPRLADLVGVAFGFLDC